MKKQFYVTIEGQQVHVTEEVYRAYNQPVWAEEKRQERSKRCQISNGKGGVKRCEGNCSKCSHGRNGSILSLDCLEENGSYLADTKVADPQQLFEDRLLTEALWAAVTDFEPENQMIIQLFCKGATERDISKAVGLSQKGVNKRKSKLFAILYSKLKDFE